MDLTVIIPTYRNSKYLDLCLKSATENRNLSTTDICVIIDGYVEESRHIVEKYKRVGVIELDNNAGMANAINMGVYNATTDYVLIINDDNILCREYDVRLMDEIRKSETAYGDRMVLTVNQVEPTGPGMFNFPVKDFGLTFDTFQYDNWLQEELLISTPTVVEDGHIFPFIVQKKWYMAIGGMDTFYCSPQVVDWDTFLKWELLGFKFPRTRALHFYHFGSIVTRKGPDAPKFREKEMRAMTQYEYKWKAPLYNKPNVNSKIPPDGQFGGFKV